MTARLDPRMKQSIRDRMREDLYFHVNRRYEETLQTIIDRNTMLGAYINASFNYKGVHYGPEQRFVYNRLHDDLKPAMDKLIRERQEIRIVEEPYIMGFFNRALNKSNSIQDYLLMFPDCMHPTLALFTTPEWQSSVYWLPRELTDEQIAKFKEDHEPWLEKLRNRMMLDLILN